VVVVINGEAYEPSTKQCSLRYWRALKGNVLLHCFSVFGMRCGHILAARLIDYVSCWYIFVFVMTEQQNIDTK